MNHIVQRRKRACRMSWNARFVVPAILLLLASTIHMNPVQGATARPVFRVNAPQRAEVGKAITLKISIQHAVDIAGYETNLLYDTAVAEFSGLGQRHNALRTFGRDVTPLGPVELRQGVAFGLYTCPVADCLRRDGKRQTSGGTGDLTLATISIIPRQAGQLELRLTGTKFVDAQGKPVTVDQGTQRFVVQVGATGSNRQYPTPATLTSAPKSSATVASADITGDGLVTNADAMEVALGWTLAREQGSVCGRGIATRLDIMRDGCLDVADLQSVAARYSTVDAVGRPHVVPANKALILTVNSTADDPDMQPGDGICRTEAGACTLRAAIVEANLHAGGDKIVFKIPGDGVQTIRIASPLPTINDASGPTTIDGTTQPGASSNTDPLISNAVIKVQIAGSGYSSFDGLLITSAQNVIRGLAFFDLNNCIRIFGMGASRNIVIGNMIGTDATATSVAPGRVNGSGVQLHQGAAYNRIGTIAPYGRNVISGNGLHGILTSNEGTNYNQLENNIIGLDPTGTRQVTNWRNGIDINSRSSYNYIGNTNPLARNVVSGNGYEGIEISHDTLTVGNRIVGNYVGTDLTGTRAYTYTANTQMGILFEDGVQNNFAIGNVVGNNNQGGIYFMGVDTYNNRASSNRVGISLDGTPIPNKFFGVQVGYHAGRAAIGPDNIIAYNPTGVIIANTNNDFNIVRRNSIFGNVGLGIDLAPLGAVNPNDAGDSDTGANEGLNFPVFTQITPTEVSGTACERCIIEIFKADTGGSGYAQGRTYLASAFTGNTTMFTATLSGVNPGDFLTATATDATGNTSEFAPTVFVSDTFSRTVTDGWGSAGYAGAYSVSVNAADYAVINDTATITMTRNSPLHIATLPDVFIRDQEVTFKVKTDKAVLGNGQFAFFAARRQNTRNEYWLRLRFTSTGVVELQAYRATTRATVLLGSTPLTGFTLAPNEYIRVRAQVVGTAPTTLRMRAWKDGTTEPTTWQLNLTDADPLVQGAGAAGLGAVLGSSTPNGPILFTFDDFVVTSKITE